MIFSALVSALAITTATPSAGNETLWAPTDFKGARVEVFDQVENGCWTNIGEVKAYATDQLELAGFNIAAPTKPGTDEPSDPLSDDIAVLILHVEGSRFDNGLCVVTLLAYFVGPVVPRHDRKRLIVNTIGFPTGGTMWDTKNINTSILDIVKSSISRWVETGKIPPTEE